MKSLKTLSLQLMIFLSCLSCSSEELTTEQCSPFFVYSEDDSAIIVSESKCLCRDYKFSKDYLGGIGQTRVNPIQYCDHSIGFPVKKYSKVASFWEEVRQQINKPREERDFRNR